MGRLFVVPSQIPHSVLECSKLSIVFGTVVLNPNRQPAYIVERWLIRFQSDRLIKKTGSFLELSSFNTASQCHLFLSYASIILYLSAVVKGNL